MFAFDKEGTHYIEASVTMADGWTVWESLAAAGTGCSCWAGIEPAVFTVPDARLAAMQIPVCYAYVVQIGGDYVSGNMVANRWILDSWADVPETDGSNRHMTAYYGPGMTTPGYTGICGLHTLILPDARGK